MLNRPNLLQVFSVVLALVSCVNGLPVHAPSSGVLHGHSGTEIETASTAHTLHDSHDQVGDLRWSRRSLQGRKKKSHKKRPRAVAWNVQTAMAHVGGDGNANAAADGDASATTGQGGTAIAISDMLSRATVGGQGTATASAVGSATARSG